MQIFFHIQICVNLAGTQIFVDNPGRLLGMRHRLHRNTGAVVNCITASKNAWYGSRIGFFVRSNRLPGSISQLRRVFTQRQRHHFLANGRNYQINRQNFNTIRHRNRFAAAALVRLTQLHLL